MSPRRLTAVLLTLGLLAFGHAAPRAAAQAGRDGGKPGVADQYGDPLPPGALARLGSVRLRHGGAVQFITFLPGGKLLTAGQEGTARLWDVATGKETHRFALLPEPQVPGMN